VKVEVPVTAKVDPKVVAEVTPKVDDKLTAPDTPKVPVKLVLPKTFKAYDPGAEVPMPTFPWTNKPFDGADMAP